MSWLTRDAADFLAELELNNNRKWFTANKHRYESSVKRPMETLAAELLARLRVLDPAIDMEPKQAVFRIYRDTRFSRDKRPYKSNAGLSISSGGKTGHGKTGVYLHVDPRVFGIASGHYFLEPAQILQIRRHIASHLEEFEGLLGDAEFQSVFGTIVGEANKVLPSEFRDMAVRQPLIANKQFYYWVEYEPDVALRDDLPDFVMRHVTVSQGLNTFFAQALGI